MIYELPTAVNIDGQPFNIRYKGNWDIAVRIIEVFNDRELSPKQMWECANIIFYEDYKNIKNLEEACKNIDWFINGGTYSDNSTPNNDNNSYFDSDMPLMIETINRETNKDIRAEKMHWWTVLGLIKQCEPKGLHNTVLTIRAKKKYKQKLEKWEQDFERENYKLVNPKSIFTKEEEEFFKNW